VPDLNVQIDVFDEQRECDESQSLQGPDGINLNSHLDVFYAILRQVSNDDDSQLFFVFIHNAFLFDFFISQVADTPQEIPFLNILQHLLSIEPKDAISDIIWDTAETLVHRATLLENREDSTRLLRTPSVQKFSCPHCRSDSTSPNNRKLSLPHNLTTLTTQQSQIGAIPAPPLPPPSGNVIPCAPPPPPSGN
jgi:inverted formin-2